MTNLLPEIEWAVSPAPVDYLESLAFMERRVAAIARREEAECVWLLEHPPCYTAGTSAKAGDLAIPHRFPVFWTGRGGQFTYHGPGQRIAYVMLDIRRRFGGDVRAFVGVLERSIIGALAGVGVAASVRPGLVGVWAGGAKIAAIGLRVRGGITFHGLSINVAPDLSHYAGIVPCGIRDAGVTSVVALGSNAAMGDLDAALRMSFEQEIGPARTAPIEARGAPFDNRPWPGRLASGMETPSRERRGWA